ncbi:hypothetical protein KFE25_013683 [Diacronema lutheri]|uniref:Choline transporter-like protein n=1 Tax=Diacronema lutheri TaxID=2081491 RepID=A0A8J5XVD1_DIALT|nr:hypothetical protein KFE25_013683 [Diacronema lutheri]
MAPGAPKGRKCTDVLCTLLFLAVWGGMLYVSVTGFLHGDPDRLLYGLDYKFDQCGRDNSAAARGLASLEQDVRLANGTGTKSIRLGGKDLAARPLYYALTPGRPRWASQLVGICTSECPNSDVRGIGWQPSRWVCTGKYYDTSNRPDLSIDGLPEIAEFTRKGMDKFIADFRDFQASASEDLRAQVDYFNSIVLLKGASTCADTLPNDAQECTVCYPSYPTVRYGSTAICLPDVGWIAENKDAVATVLGDRFDLGFIETATESLLGAGGAATLRIVADAYAAFPVILACTGAAVVLGFVWAFLMRLFIRPMVFATIVGVFLALALAAVTLWLKADSMRGSALYGLERDFTVYADVTMGFFGASAASLALYVLFLCCFWSKILLACGVIIEASKALHALPGLLLVPIAPALLAFCTLLYFVIGAFYILSAGELKVDGSGVAQIVYDDNLKGALAYHFFGCVWTGVLLNHLTWAVVAMSVVQWYFAKVRPDDLGTSPVLTATWRVLRYHFGSIVFGSLLVAIVKYVRYAMNFLKRYADPDARCYGGFVRCIWCCIDCCLRCFEKALEFISRNAYILVAIESESFCSSARHSFGYLVSNVAALGMVQTVGDAFLFLGKLFVALACAGLCALLLTVIPLFQLNTSSIILPCLIVLVASYMIAALFMGIYEMAIDTVFMVYTTLTGRAKPQAARAEAEDRHEALFSAGCGRRASSRHRLRRRAAPPRAAPRARARARRRPRPVRHCGSPVPASGPGAWRACSGWPSRPAARSPPTGEGLRRSRLPC